MITFIPSRILCWTLLQPSKTTGRRKTPVTLRPLCGKWVRLSDFILVYCEQNYKRSGQYWLSSLWGSMQAVWISCLLGLCLVPFGWYCQYFYIMQYISLMLCLSTVSTSSRHYECFRLHSVFFFFDSFASSFSPGGILRSRHRLLAGDCGFRGRFSPA